MALPDDLIQLIGSFSLTDTFVSAEGSDTSKYDVYVSLRKRVNNALKKDGYYHFDVSNASPEDIRSHMLCGNLICNEATLQGWKSTFYLSVGNLHYIRMTIRKPNSNTRPEVH